MSQRAGRDELLVTAGELAAELAQDRPGDPGDPGDPVEPGEPPVLLDVRWRLAGAPGIDSYGSISSSGTRRLFLPLNAQAA